MFTLTSVFNNIKSQIQKLIVNNNNNHNNNSQQQQNKQISQKLWFKKTRKHLKNINRQVKSGSTGSLYSNLLKQS